VVEHYIATLSFHPDSTRPEMRETRHEETEERPPGTSTFTRLPSRYYGPLERDMPLSIDRCTVSLVGRLASSHGGQVSGGLALLDV